LKKANQGKPWGAKPPVLKKRIAGLPKGPYLKNTKVSTLGFFILALKVTGCLEGFLIFRRDK